MYHRKHSMWCKYSVRQWDLWYAVPITPCIGFFLFKMAPFWWLPNSKLLSSSYDRPHPSWQDWIVETNVMRRQKRKIFSEREKRKERRLGYSQKARSVRKFDLRDSRKIYWLRKHWEKNIHLNYDCNLKLEEEKYLFSFPPDLLMFQVAQNFS